MAYDLGQRDFGENRVPELLEKANSLKDDCPDIKWHMIGNLQSNKIKKLLQCPNLISVQSIYEKKHIELFNEHLKSKLNFFIQVNTSGEENKGGVETKEEVLELFKLVNNSYFKFSGLMTMGKLNGTKEDTRQSFTHLKNISHDVSSELSLPVLCSMGMSGDFETALECGSKIVRVGSSIFK